MRRMNSGIKKGYRYDTLSQKQLEAQKHLGELHTDREILWRHKIEEHYNDNPDKASTRNYKAWKESRQRLYILIYPDGRVSRTQCLTDFCARNGHTPGHLCRIARYHAGDILAGSRYYKGIDCYKQGTLVNNRRRP